MPITVAGKTIETDEEGYLSNRTDWNEEVAKEMAKTDNCDLSPSHWECSFCVNTTRNTRSHPPCACYKAIGKKLARTGQQQVSV
jgi:tRNA 2-thiouridine synthesizing protein E